MKIDSHFSFSAFDRFLRCNYQWFLSYVEKRPSLPGASLPIGTNTHNSSEWILEYRLMNNELPSQYEVEHYARQISEQWFEENEIRLNKTEAKKGYDAVVQASIHQVIDLSLLYLERVAPHTFPKSLDHIERKWFVHLPGYPTIMGIFDALGDGIIYELKTAGRKPQDDDAASRPQLTFYALATQMEFGELWPMRIDYLVKKVNPEYYYQYTSRTDADIAWLKTQLDACFESIEKECFPPTHPQSMFCTPSWCGYTDSCKYYRKG